MLDRLIHPPMTPDQFQEPRWAPVPVREHDGRLAVARRSGSTWRTSSSPRAGARSRAASGCSATGRRSRGWSAAPSRATDTPGWYVWFLQNVVQPNASLFATLVALGELAVGLGLLVGLLTGIAAFGGVFLNGNFVLAGVLGQNPALIILGAFLDGRLAERRLDRPRPLVHPVDPADGGRAERRPPRAGARRPRPSPSDRRPGHGAGACRTPTLPACRGTSPKTRCRARGSRARRPLPACRTSGRSRTSTSRSSASPSTPASPTASAAASGPTPSARRA